MKPIRVLSLFAGIGGIDLAAEWAGMETVAFVEIDDFCRAVLRKHWPDVPQFEDVRDVTVQSLSDAGVSGIDLVCGGFPCQDVSLAGKRAGLGGERSTLWREFARIIRAVNPRWVVAENVPGLFSANSGEFFARVLRDLAAMGYDAGWGCWAAGDVGARHKRERVFIVGHRADDLRERISHCRTISDGTGETCQQIGDILCGSEPVRSGEVLSDVAYRADGGLRRGRASWIAGFAAQCGEAVAVADGGRWRRRTDDEGQCAAGGDGTVGGGEDLGAAERRGLPGIDGRGTGQEFADGHSQLVHTEEQPVRPGLCADESRGERRGRFGDAGGATDARRAESAMGEPADGLPGRLAGDRLHPAVAGPGEDQYPHEPPRVAVGIAHRARKLKALGNAVDPYQIYPLMAAIAEEERFAAGTAALPV